ncbi:hypothetical protein [Nocardiopsis xinjiangensis]|uniref:hypothetical protein n=1 Tax=Nocardiopsis xinjiangensis TaxID=124285 RepID=UPI0003449CE2|nr:hypothetical protein [Nocardiopsis xinjiangensis]
MSAPVAPLAPLSGGHGLDLDPSTRLTDEGHLLVGGCPTRIMRLTSTQVSILLRWMGGAAPTGPEARALGAWLMAAGLAHPRPPAGADASGGPASASGEAAGADADVLVLVPAGVCPEPGWLAPALEHLEDPRVGAVVPRALVDPEDRFDVGPVRARLAARLTSLTLPENPGDRAVEHTPADPLQRVPALVVRRSALPAPDAAHPAPEADTARLPPAESLSRTLPPTLLHDLVADGWSVRPEPRSRVRVEPLRGFGAYLWTCLRLGAAAGGAPERAAAAACEPDRGSPAGPEITWAGAAAVVLALAGRPRTGALVGLAGYTVAAGAHRLPAKTAVRAVGACARDDARAVVRAAEQGWAPVALAACLRRPATVAAVVASVGLTGRASPVRTAAWAAGGTARSAGTWWGAWRARSAAALVPRVRAPFAARRGSRAPEPGPRGCDLRSEFPLPCGAAAPGSAERKGADSGAGQGRLDMGC